MMLNSSSSPTDLRSSYIPRRKQELVLQLVRNCSNSLLTTAVEETH